MPLPDSERTSVPLGDAEVASWVARAVRHGRAADRQATLEMLLYTFRESAPTDAARARVKAALELAGIQTTPDVLEAPPGTTLKLAAPTAPMFIRWGRRARMMALALGVFLISAALAALIAGGDDDTVPAGATGTVAAGLGGASGPTGPAAPAAPEAPVPATSPKVVVKPLPRRRRATRRSTRARTRRPTPSPSARASVTVRLDSGPRPTFLCVDDGAGNDLFKGTLNGKRTFRGRRVRINVGLETAKVTVNGKKLALNTSPAGFDITPKQQKRLGSGERPCA